MSDRLEFVRKLPCIICANIGVDAHHIIGQGAGIMGGKADDSQTIPLCRNHHQELHHMGAKAWERLHGKTQLELLEKTNRWLEVCCGPKSKGTLHE